MRFWPVLAPTAGSHDDGEGGDVGRGQFDVAVVVGPPSSPGRVTRTGPCRPDPGVEGERNESNRHRDHRDSRGGRVRRGRSGLSALASYAPDRERTVGTAPAAGAGRSCGASAPRRVEPARRTVRYAQPQPVRAGAVHSLARRLEAALAEQVPVLRPAARSCWPASKPAATRSIRARPPVGAVAGGGRARRVGRRGGGVGGGPGAGTPGRRRRRGGRAGDGRARRPRCPRGAHRTTPRRPQPRLKAPNCTLGSARIGPIPTCSTQPLRSAVSHR